MTEERNQFIDTQLKQMADAARSGALRAIRAANSGHVGIALGAADVMTAVYANHLRFNPKNPEWRGRDRFVLSAGHGSALLYSVLKFAGYGLPALETFRKLGGLPGHPEYGTPGVEATTGPLGQGLAMAVGMAMAEKKTGSDVKVYCLCSDGDLMEGVGNEAVAFAGRYNLNNLILLWDDNQISIDGTALTDMDVPMRMYAAGWQLFKCDGHDFKQINSAITKAKKSKKPAFIQCKTIIGLGTEIAGTAAAHALTLDSDELTRLIRKFKSSDGESLWAGMVHDSEIESGGTALHYGLPSDAEFSADGMASTRELSGKYLERLLRDGRFAGLLLGGSADLADSTKTFVNGSRTIKPDDFSGNSIDYGVREHAMAAIMNGLALSGYRPYGGTFLAFSDYMRGAMRMSALMGLPVVYVLTHDSVAVGEDGPTHQPVEQLAGLRLVPNMNVLRPCNATEVAAAWEHAMTDIDRPSCIILSRQKFQMPPSVPADKIKQGAYVIRAAEKPRITLLATGSEVALAISVAEQLNIPTQVVSMFNMNEFRDQPEDYKKEILRGRVIAIEAGATAGWYEFADGVIGIDKFGDSGAGADVYSWAGFDVDEIVADIVKNIK